MPPDAPTTIELIAKSVDWTWVMSVLVVVVGGLVAILKIWGPTHVSEKKLRNSEYVNEIKNDASNRKNEVETLKTKVAELQAQVKSMEVSIENSDKDIHEIRQDYRELVNRIDDLIKQIMEMTS